MKPFFFVLILFITQFQPTPGIAATITISGIIKNKSVNQVRVGVYSDPIHIVPVNYTGQVGSNGAFAVDIPIGHPSFGFIEVGQQTHYLYFEPGKNIKLTLKDGVAIFSGALRSENQFLQDIKANDAWSYADYDLKASPDDNYAAMSKRRDELMVKLASAGSIKTSEQDGLSKIKQALSAKFVSLFRAEDACRFNSFLINFPRAYTAQRQMIFDEKLFGKYNLDIHNTVSDAFVNVPTYLNNIYDYTENSPTMAISARAKGISNQQQKMDLLNSLPSKTRDLAMARQIYIDLQFKNQPDSALLANFKSTAKDPTAINAVDKDLTDYKLRNEFIGKPLPRDILNTVIIGSNGGKLTLNDLLDRHRDTVIYIDIWGYYCPPCREQMPYARALEKEFTNKPFKIISLIPDGASDFKHGWKKYFEVALSKKGHYRLRDGFKAPLMKEFHIVSIPQYMLIDRRGRLVSYNAPRPNDKEIRPMISELLK